MINIYKMILSYDSILGIPTVQGSSNDTTNSSNMGFNLGIPALLFLILVIVLFSVLFSSLGKQSENVVNGGDSSTKLLTILMGGILIVVVVLNGLQYFYNINLTARLDNLFTDTPSIDLTVQQDTPGPDEIAPVPEIKIKEQVFHIPGNDYTYDNAGALCKAYGARLATYSEVENSYKNGSEWCSYGWSDRQLALFPTQKDTWNRLQTIEGHENDCGRAGINGGYIANPNVKFGANCYGYKPKITQHDKDMMDSTPLYPKTLKDVKEEKRVDYWRRMIPDILVAPFNKNVWSLI
jgi:hypothetical protein